MSEKIDAPMPGTVIGGKYVVEGLLGTGGMGVVLSARHQQLDQRVAIKLLAKEARHHPEVLERFTREARAAAKIQGEHVARVIDVGALDDGSPYMVMEHLDGRDLSQELRHRVLLPPGEVAHWIVEACEAIAQAHAAKIVHRDLKPGNLFLARQPDGHFVVKVLDFGISKVVDPNAPALTKTSSLVGTPYYMSPEQLTAAKSVDTRADIWALGVIMYELLAGGPPFTGDSMPAVVAAILTNEPKPLESIRDNLPPGLSDVIAKCMQTKPDARYANIAELAAAVAPFAAPRGGGSPEAQTARVEKIARVLGIVNPYETLPPDTELAPPHVTTGSGVRSGSSSSAEDATSKPNQRAASEPPAGAIAATMPIVDKAAFLKSEPPAAVAVSAPPAAKDLGPPKTQLGVETSIPPTAAPSKPARLPLVAATIVALGLLSVVVVKVAFTTAGSTDTTQTPPTTAPTPSSSGAPSADITLPPLPRPSTPPASASSARSPTTATAPSAITMTPTAKTGGDGSLPRVPVEKTSASAPTPPASSSAPKNPLDMGIK